LFYFISMPIPSASLIRSARDIETFKEAFQDAAARPVTEIAPAAAGDGAAAFGFALGWLSATAPDGLTLIAVPDGTGAEFGAAYPPGLAQFGLDTARMVHVRAHGLKDALWASEQALCLSRAHVLCLVPQDARLTLTATRRLHLAAERNSARCVLLRFDPLSPSAAWTRWTVAGAHSAAAAELGRPRFTAALARRRSGPSGQRWLLEWNAHEHAFTDATDRSATERGAGDQESIHPDSRDEMAGLVAAASFHRQIQAQRRRIG